MTNEISTRSMLHGPHSQEQRCWGTSKVSTSSLEICLQPGGLGVGHEFQQIFNLAIEVGAQLVNVLSAGVPSRLVEQAGQGVPGNPGLFGNLAHGDVAAFLEFPLGDEFLEFESNHCWIACTKAGIFAPGVDIVKFRVILGANAPYMEQSDHEWNWRLA